MSSPFVRNMSSINMSEYTVQESYILDKQKKFQYLLSHSSILCMND